MAGHINDEGQRQRQIDDSQYFFDRMAPATTQPVLRHRVISISSTFG